MMRNRLHLGCGPIYIPGFIHIDAIAAPHVDYVGRVELLDLFEDESVELVYASHVLEHFGRHIYQEVLAEWFRVLKKDGILRLAVPDFAACARLYSEGQLDGGIADILGLVCGGQRDDLDFHAMVFDRDSLTSALKGVGFSTVRTWDWRSVDHAAIDDYSQAYLPHMDKDSGTLVSLNLEAVK